MRASIVSFRAAVLMALGGMVWGIAMAISQDHSTMPAHAHLNLLGGSRFSCLEFYYRLHPAVDRHPLARVQAWIWIVATVVLAVGVGLAHSGHVIGDPIAAASSLVVLADMALFGWLVFRESRDDEAADRWAVPAE